MFLLPIVILLFRASPSERRSVVSLMFAALFLFGIPTSVGWGAEFEDNKAGSLRREGSQLTGVAGEVMPVGNRWVFVGSDQRTYRLHENLALQRIVHSLRRDHADTHWTVDGTITEFMDENFLQLSRATRTSQSKRTEKKTPKP
ncbi:hypothetical protein CA51_20070 [Rosistilla oblonga]|uniref:Uncharacterized protein n=1 Tax=Rosistilla oblonga TaxID=2527990 RepID=A0A518ISR3_9BACT|nr:hypothetical protein [Rosistilla oblonga]QDV12131.1 hypothetical protein CA51_20070 [Rosistilla oblonga]QDV56128.1 hypothetical protein Mal33_21070 [Rosistilla oblonga]